MKRKWEENVRKQNEEKKRKEEERKKALLEQKKAKEMQKLEELRQKTEKILAEEAEARKCKNDINESQATMYNDGDSDVKTDFGMLDSMINNKGKESMMSEFKLKSGDEIYQLDETRKFDYQVENGQDYEFEDQEELTIK